VFDRRLEGSVSAVLVLVADIERQRIYNEEGKRERKRRSRSLAN
jgi:hypothetical protein